MPPTCSDCSFTPRPHDTRSDRPVLVKVLRGNAAPVWSCSWCLLRLLARLEWDGQATVFLSERYAATGHQAPAAP